MPRARELHGPVGTLRSTQRLAEQRVPYCGANPIADMWSEKALSHVVRGHAGRPCGREVSTPLDQPWEQMAMAATFAGLGFRQRGRDIPHANAYPVAGSGAVTSAGRAIPRPRRSAPHGMAVSLTAPAALRLHVRRCARASPARGRGCWTRRCRKRTMPPHAAGGPAHADARHRIPQRVGRGGLPRGPTSTTWWGGTLKQTPVAGDRSSRSRTAEDLAGIFRGSMENW